MKFSTYFRINTIEHWNQIKKKSESPNTGPSNKPLLYCWGWAKSERPRRRQLHRSQQPQIWHWLDPGVLIDRMSLRCLVTCPVRICIQLEHFSVQVGVYAHRPPPCHGFVMVLAGAPWRQSTVRDRRLRSATGVGLLPLSPGSILIGFRWSQNWWWFNHFRVLKNMGFDYLGFEGFYNDRVE